MYKIYKLDYKLIIHSMDNTSQKSDTMRKIKKKGTQKTKERYITFIT